MEIPPVGFPNYKVDFYKVLTDADGAFSIVGPPGDSVEIRNLAKTGYRVKSQLPKDYMYTQALETFIPDIHSPIVFTMRKEDGPQALKRFNGRFRIPYDDSWLAIDPMSGQRNAGGSLKFSCNRQLKGGNTPSSTSDYNVQLLLIGGGFVPAQADSSDDAPDQAYEQQLSYELHMDSAARLASLRKELYIKTADNHYGKIRITVSVREDQPDAFIGIFGTMNLSGARDLSGIE